MKETATETKATPVKRSARRIEKARRAAEGAKKKPVKAGESAGTASWPDRAKQFLTEVIFELKKVVWPSRKETLASTSVVIVVVLIVGVYLGIVDAILSRLMRLVIG